jgi:hypothetical protein
MHLTHLLFLAISATSSDPAAVAPAAAVEPAAAMTTPDGGSAVEPTVEVMIQDGGSGLTPHGQALADYPQRIADQPLTVGPGIVQVGATGSYSFFQAQDLNGSKGSASLGATPSIIYGVSDPLEIVLLGITYKLADDGRNWPGVAVRIQAHDLAWYPQLAQYANLPYPILRPGVFLDFRDRLPEHFTAIGSVGYVMSIVVGDYTDGTGPIPKGKNVATQTAPFLLGLEYSPWNAFSFAVAGGYLLDAQSTPATSTSPQMSTVPGTVSTSDINLTLSAIWTPSSQFDLRIFWRGNWFQSSLGYVPEAGLGFTLRL